MWSPDVRKSIKVLQKVRMDEFYISFYQQSSNLQSQATTEVLKVKEFNVQSILQATFRPSKMLFSSERHKGFLSALLFLIITLNTRFLFGFFVFVFIFKLWKNFSLFSTSNYPFLYLLVSSPFFLSFLPSIWFSVFSRNFTLFNSLKHKNRKNFFL